MMDRLTNRQKGFTIIELLIATAIFSIVLIIFLTVIIRISEIFYKGVTLTNTQEAARTLIQNISDDIQFTKSNPQLYLDKNYFCIADHRYVFNKGVQVNSGDPDDYGIVRETVTSCKPTTGASGQPIGADAEKLLGPGMQLNDISIQPLSGAWQVSVTLVAYGSDKTVFSSSTASDDNPNSASYNSYKAPDAKCRTLSLSSQLCATATYESTILQY